MRAGGTLNLVLIADESVVHPIVVCLRQEGYDLRAIEDVSPGADDVVVLQIASNLGALLLTEDKDFGDLVYQRHLPVGTGIVLLRLEGLSSEQKCARARDVLRDQAHQMVSAFTVVTPTSVRIRPQP